MSLVKEIQRDLLDPSCSLSTILRKAKVLAYRLNHDMLKIWVDKELDGYEGSDFDDLPKYRKIHTLSFGNFYGGFGRQAESIPIPPMSLPEKYRNIIAMYGFLDGVRALETWLETKDDILHAPWPADLIATYGKNILDGMTCLSAWKVISKGDIEQVLDTIKNLLLSFVLELEAQNISDIDSLSDNDQLRTEKVSRIFNTYISGSHHVIGTGTSVYQEVYQINSPGDVTELAHSLKTAGIKKDDIDELIEAINEDGKRDKNMGFGSRVATWIGKMTSNAATGIWNATLETAPKILANALSNYYGWS